MPTTPHQIIDQIGRDTAANNHTAAILTLARFLKDEEKARWLESLVEREEAEGYTAWSVIEERGPIRRYLILEAERRCPEMGLQFREAF